MAGPVRWRVCLPQRLVWRVPSSEDGFRVPSSAFRVGFYPVPGKCSENPIPGKPGKPEAVLGRQIKAQGLFRTMLELHLTRLRLVCQSIPYIGAHGWLVPCVCQMVSESMRGDCMTTSGLNRS